MDRRGYLPLAAGLMTIFLSVVACTSAPTPDKPVHIDLVGSDSMQWLAKALAAGYSERHPAVTFSFQFGNSDTGLGAPVEAPMTIGLVSRTVRASELIELRAVVVARDGVAVIVNQKNPVSAIQSSQIPQVFSGEISTWPTGPMTGQTIQVVSREDGSGTRRAFETMVMNGRRVTPTAVVMAGEAAVADYVAGHPEAIGYVSMGGLTPGVHALAVNEVQLSPQTVESQQYPFIRSLAFIIPRQPDPEVQDFVDYAISAEGQAIVGQRFGRAP